MNNTQNNSCLEKNNSNSVEFCLSEGEIKAKLYLYRDCNRVIDIVDNEIKEVLFQIESDFIKFMEQFKRFVNKERPLDIDFCKEHLNFFSSYKKKHSP